MPHLHALCPYCCNPLQLNQSHSHNMPSDQPNVLSFSHTRIPSTTNFPPRRHAHPHQSRTHDPHLTNPPAQRLTAISKSRVRTNHPSHLAPYSGPKSATQPRHGSYLQNTETPPLRSRPVPIRYGRGSYARYAGIIHRAGDGSAWWVFLVCLWEVRL